MFDSGPSFATASRFGAASSLLAAGPGFGTAVTSVQLAQYLPLALVSALLASCQPLLAALLALVRRASAR